MYLDDAISFMLCSIPSFVFGDGINSTEVAGMLDMGWAPD
jgi:hypothetical protein